MTRLETRYRVLDALPRKLFAPIVTHLEGELEDRARAVVALRSALLRGDLPEELVWPPNADEILRGLAGSGLPALCKESPDFTDDVILTVLDVALSTSLFIESASAHFAGMALAEHAARQVCGTVACFDDATLMAIKEQARRLACDLARSKVRSAFASLRERRSAITKLRGVLGRLGPCAARGFSLDRGLLRAVSLDGVTTMRDLVAELDRLNELLRALGRIGSSDDDDAPSVLERISGPMRRPLPEKRPAPKDEHSRRREIRGCTRSGDVSRMLPVEAVALLHPTLRLAWHARRAENALLSYDALTEADVIVTRTRETDDGGTIEVSRRERGPIIVCLDASGSMAGPIGLLAKAITLHLMLVAHDERRRCFVYTFSGPGDVIEHEIAPTAEGIEAFLGFVLLDFEGGTDVSEPLRRALAKQAEADWKEADILLVTDGFHLAPPEIVSAIAERRADSALRVHGLLVGNTYSDATAQLCSPVHRFDEWLAAAERVTAGSPGA